MGREIKRVSLDFDHPIDWGRGIRSEPWPGYVRRCAAWDDDEHEGCDDCADVEPPAGEGWQLWQTTSEGSPVSPVFATAEELAVWISQNPVGFAGAYVGLDEARRWVNGPGWAPDAATRNGQLIDGITWAAGSSS